MVLRLVQGSLILFVRLVYDAEGQTYVIYDVCYNRTVVESAMSSKPLKLFIIDLAFTWLGQKYKTQLSSGIFR